MNSIAERVACTRATRTFFWLRPHPGYPAPELTASMNSHVICTDPQLSLRGGPMRASRFIAGRPL